MSTNGQSLSHIPAAILSRAPKLPPSVPPNFGQAVLPQILTQQGIAGTLSRAYRSPDNALNHSLENSRAMRNEPAIMECVEARMRCVAQLAGHLEPDDPKSTDQQDLCKKLNDIIQSISNWYDYRECLQNAIWDGRYGIQNRFNWQWIGGQKRIGLPKRNGVRGWTPLHGDKIVYRYDDGMHPLSAFQVGIRVGAQLASLTQDQMGRIEPTYRGRAMFLTPYERDLITIHQHIIEDSAYEDFFASGSVTGIGIRHRIYWSWLQMTEATAWMMEYLERAAWGVEVWYFDPHNPESEAKTRTAAERMIGNGRYILLVPRDTSNDHLANLPPMERIEPGLGGIDAAIRIIQELFGHRIKRYIMGQTMTSEAQAAGLGSDLAQVQFGTWMDIVRGDAMRAQDTLTDDLVRVLQLFNFPGSQNIRVRYVIDTETEDAEKKLNAWKQVYDMGMPLKETDLAGLVGASLPDADDKVVSIIEVEKRKQEAQQQASGQGMGNQVSVPGLPGGPSMEPQPGAEPPADQFDDLFPQEEPQQFERTDTLRFGKWSPYEGPRGGKGWKNADTGEVIYGDRPDDAVTKIGSGSSGDVLATETEAIKNDNGVEGTIYKMLSGTTGIAPASVNDGKIKTPRYPIFADTQRNRIPARWLRDNASRIANAITSLSDSGYDYGDPLQFGVTSDRRMDLIDFSNAMPSNTALLDNLGHLAAAYANAGDERTTRAIRSIADVISAIGEDKESLIADTDEYKKAQKLETDAGGTPQNFYFSCNARTIPNVAQLPYDGNAVVVGTVEPLDEAFVSQYELVPVVARNRQQFERLHYAKWTGPHKGPRGGTYWQNEAGEKHYGETAPEGESSSGDTPIDKDRAYTPLKGTSNETIEAIDSVLMQAGVDAPRIVLAGDSKDLKQPAEWRHTMIRVNPAEIKAAIDRDHEFVTKFGQSYLAVGSVRGIIAHELTHGRIAEMDGEEKAGLLAEAEQLRRSSTSWLSVRSEHNADEFLSELGSAYLNGKPMPAFAINIAKRIWPNANTTQQREALEHLQTTAASAPVDYDPSMQFEKSAKQVLDWHAKYGADVAATPMMLERCRRLASGKPLGEESMRRLTSKRYAAPAVEHTESPWRDAEHVRSLSYGKWEESDHPRAEDGRFGSGGGDAETDGDTGPLSSAGMKITEEPGHWAGKYVVGSKHFGSKKDAAEYIKEVKRLEAVPDIDFSAFMDLSDKQQQTWAAIHLKGYEQASLEDRAKWLKELRDSLRLAHSQRLNTRADGTQKTMLDHWAESAEEWRKSSHVAK